MLALYAGQHLSQWHGIANNCFKWALYVFLFNHAKLVLYSLQITLRLMDTVTDLVLTCSLSTPNP